MKPNQTKPNTKHSPQCTHKNKNKHVSQADTALFNP